MSTQWRKIAGDLREHRLQVALIALVIALGTAGVVGALNSRTVLQREIARSLGAARSPDLVIQIDGVVPAMLEVVGTHEDVAETGARRVLMTRSAGSKEDWIATRLTILPDFATQRVGIVHTHEAAWPAAINGVFIEQSSWPMLGLKIGESIRIRTPGGGRVSVPVAGLVHDTAVAPGVQERVIYAYAIPEVARQLGQDGAPDQLTVLMKNRGTGPSRLSTDLNEMLSEQGYTPRRIDVQQTTHPHAVLMATMLRVLTVLAIIAFVCSSALAAYVVSLWMKREVRQIGIMKAIGASSGHLAFQYLALVIPVVVVAALAALPAGGYFGDFLVRYNERNLNIDVANWSAPRPMLLLEFALSVAIPLVAMAVPVIRAARMSARDAIHDPGITGQSAPRSGIARVIRIPGSLQWTFSLRNLFRRPWRLMITLTALTAGGAVLLASNFTFASIMSVVDRSLAAQTHDIQVSFRRPVGIAGLQALVATVPDVEIAEAWQRNSVRFGNPNAVAMKGVTYRTLLVAYPPESRLLSMPLTAGRWPGSDEADAVVINRPAREMLDSRLGDTVEVEFMNRPPAILRIVGEFEEFNGPGFYTNMSTNVALAGATESTAFLLVKAAPGRIDKVVTELDLAFISAKTDAASIDTRANRREVMEEHFLGVVGICSLISIAAALLGAICLAAFGSLNVLERVREIGVIRTLGATPGRVTALFLAESGALVLLSALFAIGAGSGLAVFLNRLIETKAFRVGIPLVISPGALALLFSGALLVIVGVWLPVSRLVRVSVREALGYE